MKSAIQFVTPNDRGGSPAVRAWNRLLWEGVRRRATRTRCAVDGTYPAFAPLPTM